MSRTKRSISWFLCVMPLVIVVPLLTAQSARIDDATLRRAGQTGDDWLTYGLNQAETRFSPLKDIDTTNVSRVGLAWSFDLKSGGGGQEATPLVANGVIYAVTNWSVVIAVDARTGQEK
jgi:quinohemoprotein ethanol dehydrogenase